MRPGCIAGLVTASELRRQWENRTPPVLYSSPERDISLNCSSASISRILVGAYNSSMTGNGSTQIVIHQMGQDMDPGMDKTCSFSTEPVTEGVNVYECELDPPVSVDGDDRLIVSQRNAARRIGFLHDGQTDTPLISVDSSK